MHFSKNIIISLPFILFFNICEIVNWMKEVVLRKKGSDQEIHKEIYLLKTTFPVGLYLKNECV